MFIVYSHTLTYRTDTLDADLGVAVVFDESDPEDDSDFEIKEGDSDDELDEQDGELETMNGETLQSTDAMEDTATSTAQTDLDPREIDAFWLQRKISLLSTSSPPPPLHTPSSASHITPR